MINEKDKNHEFKLLVIVHTTSGPVFCSNAFS